MYRSIWVALGATALALSAPMAAQAGVSLDQATIPESGPAALPGYYVFASSGQRAFEQTFTVGQAGILDHIDVALFNNPALASGGDVVAELLTAPFDYSIGSSSPLASQVIPFASLQETFFPELSTLPSFDVSGAHIHVQVGDTFTLSLRGGAGAALYQTGASYAGGSTYVSQYVPGFAIFSEVTGPGGGAVGFRSYVASIPEPATWGLMMTGFAALGGALRRRRPSPA